MTGSSAPAGVVPLPLRGVVPPLVAPFQPDGRLDLEAFQSNLEWYAAEDLGGYLVLGSNGEAASLEEEEKLALIRTARRHAGARLLLAGTGLESTAGTVALTRKAADLGADAALLLPPHYYRSQMSPDVLRRHYETVADASPIPVLLYSVPVYTGFSFPPPLVASLAAHPRIAGIKESSGDVGLLARIVAAAPPAFVSACGSGPVFYPALCVGALAGVLAIACCLPGPSAAIHRAFQEGDHARARRLQEALTPLAVAVTATHGVAGLKAAMTLSGHHGGEVRAPLLPVSPAVREELRGLLASALDQAAAILPAL